jgi:general L-amino acid transport system ATP-binding protein
MPDKMIEMLDVNKWFGDFQVLKDINLTVSSKQKIVVCGPSGSGKSTLIRCINRLEEHQKGKLWLMELSFLKIQKILNK